MFGDRSGFSSVNKKSLMNIKQFYSENNLAINEAASKTFVKDFNTGQETALNYSKAKIIDMYGFTYGYKL